MRIYPTAQATLLAIVALAVVAGCSRGGSADAVAQTAAASTPPRPTVQSPQQQQFMEQHAQGMAADAKKNADAMAKLGKH